MKINQPRRGRGTRMEPFKVGESERVISTLESENARLREALQAVLEHVEDDNVSRVENQCTLCKTYRDMIRAALEGRP